MVLPQKKIDVTHHLAITALKTRIKMGIKIWNFIQAFGILK